MFIRALMLLTVLASVSTRAQTVPHAVLPSSVETPIAIDDHTAIDDNPLELLEISPLLDGPARAEIAHALTHPDLRGANVGVYAVSLQSGAVLLRKNSNLLLNPASNAKLVTSAAALALLGPEFSYTTLYACDGEQKGDTLAGNLYVQGRGDPSITTERLVHVAYQLRMRGIRKIEGRVILDDSYFDNDKEAKGWDQEQSDRAYIAPVGALTLNYNTVAVLVRPGESIGAPAIAVVDPPSEYITLDSKVETARWGSRLYMSSYDRGQVTHVRIRGAIGRHDSPRYTYRRVGDPTLHFGHALVGVLNEQGIKVRGRVQRGYMPDRARVFIYDRSARLADIVSELNKWSNNVMAEQLVKTLGAKIYGEPGTFAKGHRAVSAFVEGEVGWRPGSYVYENGSGLNDVNRFTPEQIAGLLAYMYQHAEAGAEFVSSLGVAGRQGTIAMRMRHTAAERRLRAKTGTLTGVSALSGYVTTTAGEPVAFSIMVNGYRGPTRPIWEVQDMIGEALAVVGESKETNSSQAVLDRREK